MKDKQLKLGGISFTSEWMEYQLLEVIFNGFNLSENFNLSWVAGKEEDKQSAQIRVLEEIGSKINELKKGINHNHSWRLNNTSRESKNLFTLLEKLSSKEINYFQINRTGNNLTKKAYDNLDMVAIFTPNALHTDYIEDAIYHKKHVLCEKPLAVLKNIDGSLDKRELDKLIELDEKRKKQDLVVMDAEHYSSKIASKIFFDNIDKMSKKYGKIVKVNGFLEEIDNPEKIRTKKLLNKKNQTGLLLDTGVHLLSLITGIGGDFKDVIQAKYGMHKDYDVETATTAVLNVNGNYFDGNVPLEIKVGKFINFYKNPRSNEQKQIEFTFKEKNNKTKVCVDFKKGKVYDDNLDWQPKANYFPVEYANILTELHYSIQNKKEPRTNLTNSIKILDAIYRIYERFPLEKCLDKGWYKY